MVTIEIARAMIAMMLAKFVLNDIPHAAGLYPKPAVKKAGYVFHVTDRATADKILSEGVLLPPISMTLDPCYHIVTGGVTFVFEEGTIRTKYGGIEAASILETREQRRFAWEAEKEIYVNSTVYISDMVDLLNSDTACSKYGVKGMLTQPSVEILHGVLLSGAWIGTTGAAITPILDMTTLPEHADWILVIKNALEDLGISFPPNMPKQFIQIMGGKRYDRLRLRSFASPILSSVRRLWYDGGVKRLPSGFILAPTSLAHWFMGSCTTSYLTPAKSQVIASFSMPKFDERSVSSMSAKLSSLGVENKVTSVLSFGARYLRIVVDKINSIDLLMDMVEPYVVPSFMYKIKKVSTDAV